MGVHPMRDFNIVPYERIHKEAVLDLTLRAWAPVFERMASELPAFVYEAFYPSGWEVRQRAVSGTSNPRSAFGSDLRFFGGDFTVEDFDNGRPG